MDSYHPKEQNEALRKAMENIRSSEQDKINTLLFSFTEGKLNCPKKSTDDGIHLQNAVFLFITYKRTGAEVLLATMGKKHIKRQKEAHRLRVKCRRNNLRRTINPTLMFTGKKRKLWIYMYTDLEV